MKRILLLLFLLMNYVAWAQTKPLVTYMPSMHPLMQVGNQQTGLVPLPPTLASKGNLLTLKRAVLYGMQHNNDLQVAELTRQINHSALITAQQRFKPRYTLSPNATVTHTSGTGQTSNTQSSLNIGPSMTWLLPEGTSLQLSAAYNPNKSTGTGWNQDMSWRVQLTQPLLKGFGLAYNEVSLKQAKNAQIQDDITLQSSVSQTLSIIINNYYAVVKAEAGYDIAKKSLKTNKHEMFVRQQEYLAGRVPRMQVVQGKLDVASAKQSITQAQQTLQTAKLTLLNSLGLPWNTVFTVSNDIQLNIYQPNLAKSDELALQQNRHYLGEKLTLKNARLNTITAKNALRWQLNLHLSTSQQIEDAATSGSLGITPSNDTTRTSSAELDLTIPFGQTSEKASLESAILQVQEDKTKLSYIHRQVLNQVQTDIVNLDSEWESIKISEEKLNLAKQNYVAAKVQLQYGKINAFTLSQQHQQLVNDENNLVSTKISYIEQVAKFEQYIGELLKSWNIHIKSPTLNN